MDRDLRDCVIDKETHDGLMQLVLKRSEEVPEDGEIIGEEYI